MNFFPPTRPCFIFLYFAVFQGFGRYVYILLAPFLLPSKMVGVNIMLQSELLLSAIKKADFWRVLLD